MTVLMNPLLMADESQYTRQELREVKRNKRNITMLSNHVADMFIRHISGKFTELGTDYLKNLKLFVTCVLENYPENDVLLQKIVIPYTTRRYGVTSGENIGKTINDFQYIIDNCNNVSARAFTNNFNEMQISVSLNFSFDSDELKHLGDREVLLPLINSKGRERTSLKSGGYLTCDLPAILKRKDHHDFPLKLNVLNLLQQVELFIDWDYVKVIKDDSSNVYERRATIRSLDAIQEEYELTGENPTIRFVWQNDSRGRKYPHAWGLNPNGREYLKGMFTFKPRMLTEEGRLEVLRYVGKMMGYDKFLFPVREEKAITLLKRIEMLYPNLYTSSSLERMQIYNDVVFGENSRKYIDLIDREECEPFLLIGALKAYFDDKLGLPVGLMLRQDATSSGIQIMGALDNCHKTLRMNNMIDDDKRYDSYTEGYNEIKPFLEPLESGHEITRDDMKYAIMTHFYCSEERPRQIMENNEQTFKSKVGVIFPAGKRVMEAILSCWTDREEYKWTLPSGNTAIYRTTVVRTGNITLNIGGNEVKVPFKWYTTGASGNFRHLPANIIQSLDGDGVNYVVEKIVEVLPNHDEFGTHPNNAVKTRQAYHDYLKDISENNYLDSILKEINPKYKGFVKANTAKVGSKSFHALS